MKHLKRYTVIGIFFVLFTGTLAHFLYDWSNGNFIVGLFTPINESIWEHMKLLFFPMLIYTLIIVFKLKENCPSITSSLLFGTLTGTLLVPILFYAYTSILGKNIFILDISIFILSTIAAFGVSYKLTLSYKLKPYSFLLYCLTGMLFILFIVFTYHPPKTQLFEDPAHVFANFQNTAHKI